MFNSIKTLISYPTVQYALVIGAFLVILTSIFSLILLVRGRTRKPAQASSVAINQISLAKSDEVEQEAIELLLSGRLPSGQLISASITYADIMRSYNAPVIIGRQSNAWLQLDDHSVSRQHAQLRAHDGQFWIIDQESANRTRIEGVAIEPNRAIPLMSGDTISCGEIKLEITIR